MFPSSSTSIAEIRIKLKFSSSTSPPMTRSSSNSSSSSPCKGSTGLWMTSIPSTSSILPSHPSFSLTDVHAARKEKIKIAIRINCVLDFIIPSTLCLFNYVTPINTLKEGKASGSEDSTGYSLEFLRGSLPQNDSEKNRKSKNEHDQDRSCHRAERDHRVTECY